MSTHESDRELLELAARVSGQSDLRWDDRYRCHRIGEKWSEEGPALWDPLFDDGDALRLAVELGLGVHQVREPLTGCPPYVSVYTGRGEDKVEEAYFHSDKFAATRRAIVRAAAEIGRKQA